MPVWTAAVITGLRERVTTALAGLDTALVNGTAGGLDMNTRLDPTAPVRGSMGGSDCAASGGCRRRCGEYVETGLAAPPQGQMRPRWPHH